MFMTGVLCTVCGAQVYFILSLQIFYECIKPINRGLKIELELSESDATVSILSHDS